MAALAAYDAAAEEKVREAAKSAVWEELSPEQQALLRRGAGIVGVPALRRAEGAAEGAAAGAAEGATAGVAADGAAMDYAVETVNTGMPCGEGEPGGGGGAAAHSNSSSGEPEPALAPRAAGESVRIASTETGSLPATDATSPPTSERPPDDLDALLLATLRGAFRLQERKPLQPLRPSHA